MKVKNRENHVNMATNRTAGPCVSTNEGKRETSRERERTRKEKEGERGRRIRVRGRVRESERQRENKGWNEEGKWKGEP